MKGSLERELKLQVPAGFALPALGGEPLAPRVLDSTYFDTPDFRLARARVTLRHRVENGRGAWQLKLPHERGRLELEQRGGPARPPAQLRSLLAALTRHGELESVAHLRTHRSGVLVTSGEGRPLAEVVLDSVALVEGGEDLAQPFEEVEIELVEGDDRVLGRMEKVLRRAGAGDPEHRPKLVRALGLQLAESPSPDTSTAGGALQAMFVLQLRRMLAHDPGTRLGRDPEDLHQLRVATRRLRAFLRAGRPVLAPEWAGELRAELGWLGGALGPVRDLDVLIAHLLEEAEVLGSPERESLQALFERLEAERDRARTQLLAALRSERYFALLDRLEAAAKALPLADADVSLGEIWHAEFVRLRKAVNRLEAEPADEALHEVRIRVKRARYATELAQPVLGSHAGELISAAKRLQDGLGAHQDAVVAEERIRDLLRRSRATSAHFAAGRLVERERARREEARAGFQKAWKRLDRLGRRTAKAR